MSSKPKFLPEVPFDPGDSLLFIRNGQGAYKTLTLQREAYQGAAIKVVGKLDGCGGEFKLDQPDPSVTQEEGAFILEFKPDSTTTREITFSFPLLTVALQVFDGNRAFTRVRTDLPTLMVQGRTMDAFVLGGGFNAFTSPPSLRALATALRGFGNDRLFSFNGADS